MHLKGKIAIVTGGSGGIGKAICLRFAKEGAIVVAIGRGEKLLEKMADEIQGLGLQCDYFVADITKIYENKLMINSIIQKYGHIDILVNNAGTDIKGSIKDISEKEWDTIIDLNLKGTFLVTQAVVGQMMAQKSGCIINMSSMAGKTGEPFSSPYCASKFGVIGFTQSVAAELGPYNINVNAVCPGPVDTPLIKKSIIQSAKLNFRSFDEELNAKFLSLTPLGRIAKPEDVANLVCFLASDEASFITGVSIDVSGGREMH